MPKVKLSDVMDAMDWSSDEMSAYVDRVSGQIVWVNDRMFEEAYDEIDGAEEAEYTGWEADEYEQTKSLVEREADLVSLPDEHEYKLDYNPYHVMEEFIETLEDESQRSMLWIALDGQGAFRRFKDMCAQLGIIEDWYAFKDDSLAAYAREWCENNKVEFINDKANAGDANVDDEPTV